jgi:hypothetical protein
LPASELFVVALLAEYGEWWRSAAPSRERNAEEERPELLEASLLLLAPIQEGVVVGMRSSPPT